MSHVCRPCFGHSHSVDKCLNLKNGVLPAFKKSGPLCDDDDESVDEDEDENDVVGGERECNNDGAIKLEETISDKLVHCLGLRSSENNLWPHFTEVELQMIWGTVE